MTARCRSVGSRFGGLGLDRTGSRPNVKQMKLGIESGNRLGALEYAFHLARSGKSKSIKDIRERLKTDGYSDRQVEGPALLKQLRALLSQAAEDAPEVAASGAEGSGLK